MKLTTHHKVKNSTTAYRIIIGSKRAKELGLVDENGNGRALVPMKMQSGVLFIPVHKTHNVLTYKDCSTLICSYEDRVFFGEINGLPTTQTWHTKSLDSAEEAFKSAIDSALSPSK